MVAFVSIVVYAFTLSKRRREDAKNLPLDDAMPADEALSRGDGAPTDAPLLTL
ncbi:MAG TPA: cbb3-type cytochrome c oxidase subunit 3 [Bacteroidetes bacterium]|nr:cbb3-type cytochrome c oxidase subunit 3 [Bacteroidota bacterium]